MVLQKWVLLIWLSALGAPAFALELAGSVRLLAEGKPLRTSESGEAVVYFRPSAKIKLPPVPAPYVMKTVRKSFSPSALPVLIGSTVNFPNEDPILHNAFSTAQNNAFDTGLYGRGEGGSHVFETVGLVRIYCNVHHSMLGHILVLDTPYFANPDANGRFHFKDLASLDGELFVWHERATLWRKSTKLDTGQDLTISLNLSKRKVPPHLNKFGKPYRRSTRGEY